MINVVLIGSGKVAYHLHKAMLGASGVALKQIIARSSQALLDFEASVPTADLNGTIQEADVYLLAVSDRAIAEVARQLPKQDALYVHTSGATDMEALGVHQRKGVLYPLQTFSKERPVDFHSVPLILEAGCDKDLSLLEDLSNALSNNVLKLTPAQRKQLHLAAVFANNFTNHMVALGEEICLNQGVQKELLRPLLRETWAKLETLSAAQAQTGPARRGDRRTLEAHLRWLNDPEKEELYKLISHSIANTYDQEL